MPALADESYVLKHNHLAWKSFDVESHTDGFLRTVRKLPAVQIFASGGRVTVLGFTDDYAVISYTRTAINDSEFQALEGRMVITRDELEAMRQVESGVPLSPRRDSIRQLQQDWENSSNIDEKKRITITYWDIEARSNAVLANLLKKIGERNK